MSASIKNRNRVEIDWLTKELVDAYKREPVMAAKPRYNDQDEVNDIYHEISRINQLNHDELKNLEKRIVMLGQNSCFEPTTALNILITSSMKNLIMREYDGDGYDGFDRMINSMNALGRAVNYQSSVQTPKNKITKPDHGYEKWVILFPGSFNPVHFGHVQLASEIMKCYGADELWMMPTPQNPLKSKRNYADKWQRYVMLEKILKFCRFNNPNSNGKFFDRIIPNYFEFTLKAPYYTAKTIKELKKIYPNYYFTLLIGTDNLAVFDKWKNSRWLYENVHIVAFGRQDGNDLNELQKKYPRVDIYKPTNFYNISSTQIRNEIANDNYINVHRGIVDYVKANKLYK